MSIAKPPSLPASRLSMIRPYRPKSWLTVLALAAAFVASGAFPRTQATAADTTELLPRDPTAWLNSPPLSVDALKGKGVVLWFFEEQCPRCRAKWPGMYDLAKRFEGQPVVFIAVNSGTSPIEVAQYAREVKLTWPIIVDPSRQYEKLWWDQEISLQNIHQVGLILPTGGQQPGRWDDLEGSVKTALEGASWKIDPKTIPAVFLPTWQSIELGNYAAAASLVKKGLVTKNPEVKAAATKVNAFVQSEIQSATERAAKARSDGDAWRAYQLYNGITNSFVGYDLPAEISAALKDLQSDSKVKREVAAAKALEGIQKSLLAARSDTARKRIASRLEQFISQYADSEAAVSARQLIRDGQP